MPHLGEDAERLSRFRCAPSGLRLLIAEGDVDVTRSPNDLAIRRNKLKTIDRFRDWHVTDFIILITDHGTEMAFVRQLHGLDPEARCKNPIQRRRRAATLQMTQHAAARLLSRTFCNFPRDDFANPTKPKLARLNVALHLFAMLWSCAFRNHHDRSQTTSSFARLNYPSNFGVIEWDFRNQNDVRAACDAAM